MLDHHWPLFGLRITTPRLELRYPTDSDLAALADLALEGIHSPDLMPFNVGWSELPSPARERGVLQHMWKNRAEWTPELWHLPFTVAIDGEVAGVQSVIGRNMAILRQAETGSWLGMRFHGQGIGTEMRAAVLHFAFETLGATLAVSGAFDDNHASLGVSAKLGYRHNGTELKPRRDATGTIIRLLLDRETWEKHRRDGMEVHGFERCLDLFGMAPT